MKEAKEYKHIVTKGDGKGWASWYFVIIYNFRYLEKYPYVKIYIWVKIIQVIRFFDVEKTY